MKKKPGPKKGEGGRPRKQLDKTLFEKLCMMLCTEVEIADAFDISIETLNVWCKRTYGETFLDTYKKKSCKGKRSLRRKQFEVAMNGNVGMLIWLGKQFLGQSEKIEQKVDETMKTEIVYKARWGGMDEPERKDES